MEEFYFNKSDYNQKKMFFFIYKMLRSVKKLLKYICAEFLEI